MAGALDIATNRNAYLTTSLAEGRLLLEEMTGFEGLGQVFGYELALLSLDPNVDLAALLGEPMTVHVVLPQGERVFNGIVDSAQYQGDHDQYTRYHVTLRPWLWMLSYTTNCRIFQDKTVPDIIKEVFRDAGFSDFKETLGTYEPREFCVQYRESDLDFVSRLIEEEGIYYYFEHAEDKHTLVLTDSYSGHSAAPGFEDVSYRPPQDHHVLENGHINQWSVQHQLRSGSYAATDFDFKNPKASLLSRLDAAEDNANADGALFDYPGKYLTKKAGDNLVRIRLQERQLDYEVVQAAGDVRGLAVGGLFSLSEYPRDDQNKEYLIVTASYQVHGGQFLAGGGSDGDEFHGQYTLIDSSIPFRPGLHTHKARVEGPQTAVVVGPDGEEIWVDKYGRVKVQFHWDRYGTSDEDSSCWVRVSQAWAGAKWGSMHIPRIGQEVIVDFLEGDPDRPIITGRVYNDDQMPPYDLPDNKTQSGIKSRSTPKGGPSNFNEIRFEDKKGSEELFIQAEKTQTTNVKGSQSISVAGSRSISVGGDESTSVTGNRSATITKNETQTFKADRKMNVTGTNTDEITGAHTGTYHGGRTETVEQGDTLTVQGSDKTVTVHGNYNTTADTQFQVTQGPNRLLIKDAVDVDSQGKIHVHNPQCSVTLDGGKLTIEAAEEISLSCGGATITLKKDGTVEINGSQKVSATGGGSGVELAAAGAKMSGTKATISGTAMTEITGAIVKIN